MDVGRLAEEIAADVKTAIDQQDESLLTCALLKLASAYEAEPQYAGNAQAFVDAKCLNQLSDGLIRYRSNWLRAQEGLVILDLRSAVGDESRKKELFARVKADFEKEGWRFYSNPENYCLGISLEKN